jgi:hypothetical protein
MMASIWLKPFVHIRSHPADLLVYTLEAFVHPGEDPVEASIDLRIQSSHVLFEGPQSSVDLLEYIFRSQLFGHLRSPH